MANGGVLKFLEDNPTLAIGGGVVLVLLVGGIMASRKAATPTANQVGADLSGLQPGNLVYVPTQTTFSTVNQGAFSNDPKLQTVTNSGNTTNTSTQTTTTTTTKTINKDGPPEHTPPKQPPPPGTKGKSLKWTGRYTIGGGETLSAIASKVTRSLHSQGMPGNMSVTWHDLYAHNTGVINSTAAAHHNPVPGGPWNDIFPGEVITIPVWG